MEEKARHFEDLRVFQQAREMVRYVYTLTATGALARDYALRDQLRRSAISILSNIAEGFERQSNAEFTRFLFVAKGSCGELRAQGLVAYDQKYWSGETHKDFLGRCRTLSAGLANFIKYLQKSGFRSRQTPPA
jgi:four helix bundle protein